MALELCSTDLHQVLRAGPHALPPAVIKRWLRELLRGVAAVHEAGVLLLS